MQDEETISLFRKALRKCTNEEKNSTAHYQCYLKNILGHDYDASNIDYMMRKIKNEYQFIDFALSTTKPKNKEFVKKLLKENKYFSKNTKRAGIIVKMFQTEYNGKPAIVKAYIYDPKCKSVMYSVETSFNDEVAFQNYAKTMNRTHDFISPEIYSIGKIRVYTYPGSNYEYRCLYIIMEYIPGITLKNAIYSTETMKDIYEKVDQINHKMQTNLLNHNDLHSSNIIIRDASDNDSVIRSPMPQICIIDFGEASHGPRKKIYI
jgi:serine/threonine protein kinase